MGEKGQAVGRVVGILGASYSGSTILTMLLGALPKSVALGETHWLYDFRSEFVECPACGSDCSLWTSEFLTKLHGTKDWWGTIRENLNGYEWLISSDKVPDIYRTLGKPDVVIVLWKDARSWYRSVRRHEGMTIEQAIASWCEIYEDIFLYVEEIAQVIYVDWDQFTSDPERNIQELQISLGRRDISPWPSVYGPCHMIGGNREARGEERTIEYSSFFGREVRRDDRWHWDLSQSENEAIAAHPRVNAVVRELRRRAEAGCRDEALRRLPPVLAPKLVADNLVSLARPPAAGPDYLARPLVGFFDVVPVVGGPRILMFTNNDCVVTRLLALDGPGSFEPFSIRLWAELARESTLALDIGAFTGVFALIAAKMNPALRVAAFEPNPLAFARLLTNIKANEEVGRIMAVRAGASDRSETLALRHPFGVYTLASGESFDAGRIANPYFVSPAEVVSLDAFLAGSAGEHLRSMPMAFDSARVVAKIDVEGFEPRVVRGMRDLIGRGRTTLLFECLDPAKFSEVAGLLSDHDIRYVDETARKLSAVDRGAVPVGNFLARPAGVDWSFVERAAG